ncbi:MAG: AMP-binding protein [Clostridia bacterium]|nr:AMP-binding protein [Clostridia bacterium]
MLVYNKFIDEGFDAEGRLNRFELKPGVDFNFGFDCVDVLGTEKPNKTAMMWVSKHGEERRFTFEDMMKNSNKCANYFTSLGIKKGDRVMLVLKRHYQFWFAIVALHKIGAIVIPATNQLMKKDFIYRFNAAGVKAIVCTSDDGVLDHVDAAVPESPTLQIKCAVGEVRDGWRDFNAEFETFPDTFPRAEGEDKVHGTDLMLMYFTSGTTGYPKIAAHNNFYPLGHVITAKYWHNVDPEGLHFTVAETGWGKAVWGKLYGQWLSEAGVFTYDFDRFDGDAVLKQIEKHKITTFCAPPTIYRFFIKEDLSKYDLSSLKYATTAGEALNPEVFNKFKEHTGLSLMEGFGQTETALTVANLVGSKPKPGSMGKPSPQYHIEVVDEDGNPVKPGAVGEIVVNTKNGNPLALFAGYFLDEEKTKAVWHDGFYHTGDTAWKDEDGYFWYVGRTDDIIKSSGYRIGPFEVENVLMEHPAVLECAVTAVPDPVRGQAVKATIVLTKEYQPSDELVKEIQNHVKNRTAPYKYPRVVEFVTELPKTISGKIRRVEIRNGEKKN